jgi:hypothetical protein
MKMTTKANQRFAGIMQQVREGLAEEFAASEALQREFLDAGNYAAFVLSLPEVRKVTDHMRARFEDAEFEAALQRAEAAGRARARRNS